MLVALRLILELSEISGHPVGDDFKPTSYLHKPGRLGDREGVFAKGLRLKDSVRFESIHVEDGYVEVVAIVPSESGGREYRVKLTIPLDFECTCPYQLYHFNPCKHVYAVTLKLLEQEGVDIGDWRVMYLTYVGLNKLAYLKAKTATLNT